MNREKFIAELQARLSGMPDEERRAAVQYYEDYFADAGEENEADVIRELGSPEKVAESIKADYYGTQFNEEDFEHKDYMEKYTRGARTDSADSTGTGFAGEGSRAGNRSWGNPQGQNQNRQKPWTDNRVKILLIILIAIVLWPLTLGIGIAALGIAAAVIGFFAFLVVAAVGIMFAGVVTAGVGVALLVIPPAAFIVIGIGILLFACGLAATVGMVKLCIIVYPAMLRGFVNLCRRPFYGKAV